MNRCATIAIPALAFLAALAAGCAGGPAVEGDQAMEAGDYAWALVLYSRAVEEGRVPREAVQDRIERCGRKLSSKARAEAEALAERGDFEGAVAVLEESLGLVPQDERLAEALGAEKIRALNDLDARAEEADARGDDARALTLWDKARACEPKNRPGRVARSLAAAAERAWQAKRCEAAWAFAGRAAAFDPELESARALQETMGPARAAADELVRTAGEAARDGNFEEAAGLCREALEAWPCHAQAALLRPLAERERAFWDLIRAGDLHRLRREWDEAVSRYEKAQAEVILLGLDRKIREARSAKWTEEGRRLEDARDLETALEAYAKALDAAVDRKPLEDKLRRLRAEFHFGRAAAFQEARDWVRAHQEFRKAEAFVADPMEVRNRLRALRPHIVLTPCATCKGSGTAGGDDALPCSDCGGTGETAKARD